MRFLIIPILLCSVVFPTVAEEPSKPEQSVTAWVWKSVKPADNERVFFRREFQLPPNVTSGEVTISCDDWHRLIVNGKEIGMAEDWLHPRSYDVFAALKPGERNVIAVEARNNSGYAGMALRFRAILNDGKKLHVVTDGHWSCIGEVPPGWQNLEFSSAAWPKVAVIAKMGDPPWGEMILPEPDESMKAVGKTAELQR